MHLQKTNLPTWLLPAGGAVLLAAAVILALVLSRPSEQAEASPQALSGTVPTAEATEQPPAPPAIIPLSDVAEDDVCYEAVQELLRRQVMTAEGLRFRPLEQVSRASAITSLYRLAEGEASPLPALYADVAQTDWFAEPVSWALDAGVLTAGTPQRAEVRFRPSDPVTRWELALMLSRLADAWGLDTASSLDLSGCRDFDRVPPIAVNALAWALERGLLPYASTRELAPDLYVSRAQLAQTLIALLTCQESGGAGTGTAWRYTGDFAPDPAIAQAVEDAAARHKAAGVQVAVVRGGQVSDTYAWGWATRDTDPMTADHKIRVASLSKVVVGSAAALLQDQGIVDINADISAYWGTTVKNPTYPDIPVTLHTLLTHTSSLYDSDEYSNIPARLQGSGYRKVRPGDLGYWSYNNLAFGALGMTLERAAGQNMDQILRHGLVDAMDMDTSFASGSVRHTELLSTIYRCGGAVGHSIGESKSLTVDWEPGTQGRYFAGGFTSSARDMGKLVALLANGGVYQGVQLLSDKAMDTIQGHDDYLVGGTFYQCHPLRLRSDLYGRDQLYYHTGSAYGVFNFLSYDPATGDGVVVLTSGADGAKDDKDIYAICGEIATAVYAAIQEN